MGMMDKVLQGGYSVLNENQTAILLQKQIKKISMRKQLVKPQPDGYLFMQTKENIFDFALESDEYICKNISYSKFQRGEIKRKENANGALVLLPNKNCCAKQVSCGRKYSEAI